MNLRQVEAFRTVMLTGKMTAAAELMSITQPAVSRLIRDFEIDTKLKLFNRRGNQLIPTQAAMTLLQEVERAYVGLERINSVAQSIRRFEHGQLSLSCLPLFSQTLLPPVCKQFQAQHPGIGLSITAQESPLLEEALSAQRHDLGLTESEHLPRGTQGELLFCADMVCILADDHPLLARPRLALADFRGQDFINLSGLDIYRQTLDEHFRQAGVDRRIVVETTNAASVCAMVRQRLGVAIINPLSAMEEAGRGLAIRPLQLSVPYRVMLIRPDYRPSSSFVEGFSEALRTQAKALQEQVGRIVQGGQGVNRSG